MKVKDFKERKLGISNLPKQSPHDIFTELKDRRQELENITSIMGQYIERNEILDGSLVLKNVALEEVNNKIDLSYEELDNINTEINLDKKYREQVLTDIEKQESELLNLIKIIKERVIDADELQQGLTGFKNKQTEFNALQENSGKLKQLITALDAELLAKQALIETFERNYTKKLHREVKIKGYTKFNQVG